MRNFIIMKEYYNIYFLNFINLLSNFPDSPSYLSYFYIISLPS